jgi:alkylation response protein AidB-like acyl-CoA dehydrogenase
MDFRFGEKEEKLREEIKQFAKKEMAGRHVVAGMEEESRDEDWEFSLAMSKKLSQKGWLTMAWPKEYGGQGASFFEQYVYTDEASYWGIPGTTMGVSGIGWVGQSLMIFGTEEQRKKYIPLIAAGDPDGVWCTAYSEPNAGSDFANLQTKAIKTGDEYVVNGQKIWTSCAHRARWCWMAVRTDPNAQKKQHGISLLIIDMKSPGITLKPIVNYTGVHIFNEFFLDNVRVPVANLVGVENKGWYHLMQSLAFERHSMAPQFFGSARRILEYIVRYTHNTSKGGKPMADDPVVRHKLAERAIELETLKLFGYEITFKMAKGQIPIHEAARNKFYCDYIMQRLSTTGSEIIGAYAQVDAWSKWAKLLGAVTRLYSMFPGLSVAAGTDEVQKNIIGQFKLGLPRPY